VPRTHHRILSALTGPDVVRPPGLQTDEGRSASRLDLFFDLAFVLVVAELATAFREDVSLHGLAVFAGLFTTVWWSWVSSTVYANRFDHDDAVFRLLKLAGMAAVIGLAATATEATGDRTALFAWCNVLLRGVLLLQYLRVHRHVPEARAVTRPYLAATCAGGLLWAVSTVLPAPACFVLWGLAVVVEVAVPLVATRSAADAPLHLEHLPERFALFVILVLGEAVAAVARGVHDAEWTAAAVAVAAVSFVLTAGLWWSHFDLAGLGARELLSRAGVVHGPAHEVYVLGLLPLCLALALVGTGIELAVLESSQGDVPLGTRLLLAGGVALYLASVAVRNSAMTGRWRSGWWWPLTAAVLAGLDVLLDLPALAVVGALAALLVAVVVTGIVQRAPADQPAAV
jgi:low temperature requirement protein LtrA